MSLEEKVLIIISTSDYIIIPKYNKLNQSPSFCSNRLCIKNCTNLSKSQEIVNINKQCINKHITRSQNLDEYYFNKYMK
jgi:hypothetical protein